MLYLDTSLLVTALVPETNTSFVHDWLVQHATENLTVSDWVITEFASALALKRRTGSLSDSESDQVARAFGTMTGDMLSILPVMRRDFVAAAALIGSVAGLKAGDGLHLAIALRESATLCSLDQGQLRAAREAGASVDSVLP